MQNPLEGLSEIASSGFLVKKEHIFPSNEPISVLDTGWSPSPSTSNSTFSSSLAGDNKKRSIFMVPENTEGLQELNPFPEVQIAGGGGEFGFPAEDWEREMSESALLRWVSGESDPNPNPNPNPNQNVALGFSNQSFAGEIGGVPINNQVTLNQNLLPPLLNFQEQEQEQLCFLQPPTKRQNLGVSGFESQEPLKPTILEHQSLMGFLQNPSMVLKQEEVVVHHHSHHQHQHHQQHLGVSGHESQEPLKPPILEHQSLMGFLQNPSMVLKQEEVVVPPPSPERHHHSHHHQQQQQQKQVVYDQLYKAAELIQSGNFSHAQGILARLNYHLSPLEKPFQRAAFYFKEALLQLPFLIPPAKNPTPVDGILKMGAYKLLSEASPLIQFMNFTSNQALLEAVGDSESVHVIDFDVGFGAQWASFIQELTSVRTTRTLKITAFASPSTHHRLDLSLMHQTLTHFASNIGINLELEVVNFDDFDPDSYPILPNKHAAVVVNFPIWACSSRLSLLPSLLHFVKRLNPKIVVSLERGCDRPDLPFAQHILQSLHHYEALFDSMNAGNISPEGMNKVERLLIQPKIESIVWGRFLGPASHVPHSRDVFGSAGFYPVGFSSFSETQAEYVLKRSPVKGFRVEKRNGSLVLYWRRMELVLASAWRC